MSLFSLNGTALDTAALGEVLRVDAAGACAVFEGRVRDHNDGRAVLRLEYEAWDKLALREGARIVAEAIDRFRLERAMCVHRTGTLSVGEVAVWVGVSSAHREEAFAACRYIIDHIKHEVPIWKKEHYADGKAEWVNCHRCAVPAAPAADADPKVIYARQICLPEVGEAGQKRLAGSRVLVVGAGGLGSPALMYLAAAGVGRLTVCDRDTLEVSNLHRQILFERRDLGGSKTRLALRRLEALNPQVELVGVEEPLDASGIEALFAGHDLVLDCTDNFATRFLLNDAAVLTATPLISASIYQYEGQVQLYDPSRDGACLRCLWRDPPATDAIGNCATAGVLGPVAGVFGSLQAAEALKFLLGFPDQLDGQLLLLDLRTYRMRTVRTHRDEGCPVCTRAATLDELHGSGSGDSTPIELDITSLPASEQSGFTVVDIRETAEIHADPLLEMKHLDIPAHRLIDDSALLTGEGQYLLCCSIGFRSRNLVELLRQRGHANVYSQRGGIAVLRSTAR